MSRIADAYGRAGRRLPGEERRWEAELDAVARHMGEKPQLPTAKSQLPIGEAERRSVTHPDPTKLAWTPQSETIDFELASAIRRIFMAPDSVVRSVLFCTPPGDPKTDVAWSVAELLASQSGERVALVADGSALIPGTHALVTCMGWYEPASQGSSHAGESGIAQVPGERTSDLYPSFPYVIVSATAQRLEDLRSLARQVDGVIVVLAAGETRKDIAAQLVGTLGGANLLGAILTTGD